MQRPDRAGAPRAGKPRAGGEIGASAGGADALILGAIIAGGQSSRFGSDKAVALLDGVALIDHAAATLRPHVDALVICGHDRPGWQALPDRPHGGLGPLGGLAAALHHAVATGHDRVLAIGCDMPRIPATLLDRLVREVPAYCRDAPILGCWPVNARDALDDYLLTDTRRSIRGFGDRIGAAALPALRPLANINRPADLAAL